MLTIINDCVIWYVNNSIRPSCLCCLIAILLTKIATAQNEVAGYISHMHSSAVAYGLLTVFHILWSTVSCLLHFVVYCQLFVTFCGLLSVVCYTGGTAQHQKRFSSNFLYNVFKNSFFSRTYRFNDDNSI